MTIHLLFYISFIKIEISVLVDIISKNNIKLFVNKYTLLISLMSRVFTNGPGDQGSISGRVIPKTQKMVLDAALLNSQHY